MKKEFVLVFLSCLSLFGETVFTSKAYDRALTLYNNNTAFINEKRDFTITHEGLHNIIYEGVANSIITDSIIPKFSDNRLKLYTQTFEKNRADFSTLLSYYKQNDQAVNFFQPTSDRYKRVVKKGYILSKSASRVTIQEAKSKNVFEVGLSDIFFNSLPKELKITKPTLTWRVKGYKGKQSVELSYLARGLSWEANYALSLDGKASLKGWITINNKSGLEYKDSTIFCVAGSVNAAQRRNPVHILYKKEAMDAVAPRGVKQESFGGYHLYKIPFKEDIQKGSKQILFIDKKDIKYKEYAKMDFSVPVYPLRGVRKSSLFHIIEIKNDKKSSLGIPLPKGTVRVYAKDSSKKPHFVGQSRISHTPVDEKLKLNIGRFFDVTSKITQVKFNSSKNRHYIYSKIKIELKNKDSKDRDVVLVGRYPLSGNYKITSTCEGKCTQKKISSGEMRYDIELKSKEDYTFFIEYRLDD